MGKSDVVAAPKVKVLSIEEDLLFISIEGLPPSTNHAYVNVPGGGRALSKQAAQWKEAIFYGMKEKGVAEHIFKFKSQGRLSVNVSYHGDKSVFYTEAGDVKKWDVDGRHKVLVDAVFSALKVDDCNVWHFGTAKHVDTNIENPPCWTAVTISTIKTLST